MLNRITSAEEKTETTVNWNQTYTFDRYGNRNFNENLTTTLPKGCVDGSTAVVCEADKKMLNPDLDASDNRMAAGQGWAYDAVGNVITDPEGRTFAYDAENKQTEVQDSSSQTIGEYFLDGDGKRVKKHVPSTGEVTVFVYDAGGKLVAEYSTIVASTNDAKVAYLTNDHLGSPRINTDANGTVVSRSDYMPYGEEIVGLGNRTANENYVTDDVRQGFTGYENDDETELNYAKARMQNPILGRFSSPDPLYFQFRMAIDPQVFNLYAYTRNNPHKWVDPDGEKLYLRGNTDWLRNNVLYEIAGGQEQFDRYFQIDNGQVVLRQGVDTSDASTGVQLLLDMVNSAENFLYFAGTDGNEAADLFQGSRDDRGRLTRNGLFRRDRFEGNRPAGSSVGFLLGTTGRVGQNQPVNLVNGDPVFAVIAYNTNSVLTQSDITPLPDGRGESPTLRLVNEAMYQGLGQVVRPSSFFIHESAENLSFATMVPEDRADGYNHAHRNAALPREAIIRKEMKITGGYSGGEVSSSVIPGGN